LKGEDSGKCRSLITEGMDQLQLLTESPETWPELSEKFTVLCKPYHAEGAHFLAANVNALTGSLTEMTQYDYPHHSY